MLNLFNVGSPVINRIQQQHRLFFMM